jgi:hypothetical protein
LSQASPDLLRRMVQIFAEALMSADADAVCGAAYGQRSPDRRNIRNGYRWRGWDTGPAASSLRQLSLSASLSFSLIRGRSLRFTIGCQACNGRPAVWSEHRRMAEGRLGKRVGCKPSQVRIPHPPPLVSDTLRRPDVADPGGGLRT